MFKRLFPRRRPALPRKPADVFTNLPANLPADMRDEIMDLCRRAQTDALRLSGHLRRDVGLDCGCFQAKP